MEHGQPASFAAGRRRVLITGAGGQLGSALADAFADDDVIAATHGEWDVSEPYPSRFPRPDLVLHAAAWTEVDRAEENPEAAFEINERGTKNVVAIGAPVVYFSTDYVFDGRKRAPYVESDEPNPLSAYARSKLAGEAQVQIGWVVRTSWLFGPTGKNFVRAVIRMCGELDELTVVDDQRGCPTYVGHLAAAVRELVECPEGIWHLAADGDCTWADFADEIVRQRELPCRIRRITSEELGRQAPRPAYSVLRSERPDAPRLPHWREGLRACLGRLRVGETP